MLTAEIATRLAAMEFRDMPALAVETAKQAVMDTLGTALAGTRGDALPAVERTVLRMAGKGRSLALGHGRIDAVSAALINATAAHALDFDDIHNTISGHPSTVIVPALWSLAEDRGLSGRDVILAYIAGLECETRVALAVNMHHYDRGWHVTATLGAIGCAAACSRLLGFDPGRMAHALALATSMSAGMRIHLGSPAKPLQVGNAARNGLFAALLAEDGMEAKLDALEGQFGLFEVYNGRDFVRPERVMESWAAPLQIVEPGLYFKRFPCCGGTHAAIDATLALRQQHGVKAEDIGSIEVWNHPRRVKHIDRPAPQTGLDGKFSTQYVVARAIIDGKVGIADFTDEAVVEPAIRSLLQRIRFAADPLGSMSSSEHFYAKVRITTRAGDVLETYVDRSLGRDRAHPLPAGALEAKFVDCAAQVMTTAQAGELLDRLQALEDADITETSSLIGKAMKLSRPSMDLVSA